MMLPDLTTMKYPAHQLPGPVTTPAGADHLHPHSIKIQCASCRSENVGRDAMTRWNVETQKWEMTTIYDHGSCEDCDGETLVERWAHNGEPVGPRDTFADE